MDRKEQKKAYREANKDKIKEYKKEYYLKNKEKIKEQKNAYMKEYYQANTDKIKEYQKSPNGKKSNTICDWKRKGLLSEDYDSLYQKYIESTNCEECNCYYGKYKDGSWSFRCMDHCHITGVFRNFLCNRCNIRRGE